MHGFDIENSEFYLKRVAKYIRVSTEEQARHGYSVAAQIEALDDFAKRYHMQVIGTYCDDGVSARKAVTKRKELMRLLDDVKQGKVDYIIFIKLDRWFRSIKEYYKVQEILDTNGVGWKAIMEDYDTATTNGRLNLNIRLSIAQDESDRTGDRIRFVNENRVRHGGVISGSLPYGLKSVDGRAVPGDESSIQIVNEIFDYYEQQQSRRGCINFILENYGVRFGYGTIAKIISNPLYKGSYRDNPSYCTPIIDPTRFDRIQQLVAKNSHHNFSTKHYYIFSRIVRCGVCGHTMIGYPQRDRKFDRIYLRYRCNNCWRENHCSNKTAIWEGRIEKYLLENIKPKISQYIKKYEIENKKMKRPVIETGKIKAKLQKLKNLYLNDLIELDDYRTEYTALKQQLDRTTDQPQSVVCDITALKSFLESDFETLYESMTPQEKRGLWSSVISEISVTDINHISIKFF